LNGYNQKAMNFLLIAFSYHISGKWIQQPTSEGKGKKTSTIFLTPSDFGSLKPKRKKR
jgi:hypothetical protein